MRHRSFRKWVTSSLASAFLVMLLGDAMAQVTTGTILGRVKDETGAFLPGVTVVLTHLDTGSTRTLLTDSTGSYRASNLPLGRYEVRAELTGFQAAVRRGIELAVGREAVVDFQLKIGEISEQIVVTGEAPLVDTTRATVSAIVDEQTITDLPLNGRSFDQLSRLQPGVHAVYSVGDALEQGRGQKMSIGGARPQQNSFILDGTSINNHNNSTPGSASGTLFGVDTLREFEILTTTYSAEYGSAGGGIVNVVTKSGTNELHGTVFGFHRNDNLDARNFFDPGEDPPEFKRNQFGATLGGPVLKNRFFFLGAYEGLRERLGTTQIANVPDADARQGRVRNPATGVFDNVRVAPAIVPFLNLFPLPNGRNFGNGTAEHLFSRSEPTDEDFVTGKLDYKAGGSDSFFGRYTFIDGFVDSVRSLPTFSSRTSSRNQYLTLGWTRVLSPTLLNSARVGFNRTRLSTLDQDSAEITPGMRFIPELPMGTVVFRGDLSNLGPEGGPPERRFLTNEYTWEDTVDYNRGNHSIKFGGVVKRFQWNPVNNFRLKGEFAFNNMRDFLVARARDFRIRTFLDPAQGIGFNPARGYRQTTFGFFFQDDIRVRQNLTLNLGLRYDPTTVMTEQMHRLANFRSLNDTTFSPEPFIANPSLRNFAPRLGIAWDPQGQGKMSIRTGFGLFYDPLGFFLLNSPLDTVSATVSSPPFPNVLSQVLASRNPDLRGTEFQIGTPYYMKYSLGVQREIARGNVVSIYYAGSRGVKLLRSRDINTALPIIQADGRKFFPANAQRRNPNLGDFGQRTADINSVYHSLQLSFRRRLQSGFQFQSSYTLAKSIDEAAGQYNSFTSTERVSGIDPDDRNREQGLSNFDVRHNLSVNWSYELPLRGSRLVEGWEVSGILTLAAGSPFAVENSFNRSRNLLSGSNLNDRPDLKAGASNSPVLGGPDRYFDAGAFQLQEAGYLGNLGRNTVIGPGVAAFDAALHKNTRLREGVDLQFRAEFFNVLNRPNFGPPGQTQRTVFTSSAGVPSGQSGRLTATTTSSRQIQFGLKLIF
ncbi:MAG: TonB-dependent receptor [Acidobacteria bacterium]|nr:TonB-dependent receptor [Acidobacteriota bacterium]